jgi:hypothetical protein
MVRSPVLGNTIRVNRLAITLAETVGKVKCRNLTNAGCALISRFTTKRSFWPNQCYRYYILCSCHMAGLNVGQNPEVTVKEINTVKIPTLTIKDDGRVRIGVMTPLFPPVRSEPENVADGGKVRLGVMSPTFPPVRSR